MATTSGTVGQTTIDVSTIVEHSFRRCGKLPSTISSEQQLAAKESLFFLLSDLANRGLSLWCVQKHVLGVVANQIVYPMPVGTVDVNACLYRQNTDLSGSTITGTGWQGLDLGSGNAYTVNTVKIAFSVATTATLVIESSTNATTWVQRASLNNGLAAAAGAFICADVDNATTDRYWRVRDTSGTLAAVSSLTMSTLPVELPMSKMSNDSYTALPNKTYTVSGGSKSLQYWYDKQINPQIWVWPAVSTSTDQIVVWTQSHIQDVGSLSNALNIPQRWYESVIFSLACRVAVELPAGELPDGRLAYLEDKANFHLLQAEDGESDGAPIRVQPNIRGYSR